VPARRPGPTVDVPPEQALERAEQLIELNRWRDALQLLGAADLAALPAAMPLRAQCLLALDDTQSALEVAQRARAALPESEHAHRLAAIALHRLRRHRPALDAAEQAVAAEVTAEGLHMLVICQINRRKYRAAHAATQRLLSDYPDHPLAQVTAATLARHRNDSYGAEWHARQALALDPGSESAQALLAAILRGHRETRREARRLTAGALRANPQATRHRDALVRSRRTRLGIRLLAQVMAIRLALSASSLPLEGWCALGVGFALAFGRSELQWFLTRRDLPTDLVPGLTRARRNVRLRWLAGVAAILLLAGLALTISGRDPTQLAAGATLIVVSSGALWLSWHHRTGEAAELRLEELAVAVVRRRAVAVNAALRKLARRR
jgi:tetratricopeptide (TPR) repeat protein